MKFVNTAFILITALASFGSLLGSAQSVAAGSQTVGKTVTLLPGTCPSISQGDYLDLDWNPGYEARDDIRGLGHVFLSFKKVGPIESDNKALGQFSVQNGGASSASSSSSPATVPLANGYVHLHLRIFLGGAEAGEYHLSTAIMAPRLPPDFDGPLPVMNNSPLKYSFCVNVVKH